MFLNHDGGTQIWFSGSLRHACLQKEDQRVVTAAAASVVSIHTLSNVISTQIRVLNSNELDLTLSVRRKKIKK